MRYPRSAQPFWANLVFILSAIPITICAIKISTLGGFDFYGNMYIPTFPDDGRLPLTAALYSLRSGSPTCEKGIYAHRRDHKAGVHHDA